ncbi:site-specific DNA-methyltransferase [uncultured Gemella sp.]|uniref:site-specific DNA-methyltransferase n=1 Tax=uncultured Gemella sp. TaxID=254352 RepID=UPI0028D08F05|nr:site-specific DNA-methyltransferase [uncultured Gemella sp.]
MEKMRMESLNLTSQNIEKIEALFPNCITESRDENGQLKKSVNFKMLKQMLSEDIVDGEEAYEFTWVGKKESIVEANKPIRKTLRPAPEESVDWDNTENLYIEGDNLEVLKLLQESYLGKVKMIYIDPPYNTGNDFIYNDDFKVSNEEYAEESGEYDEEGNRMFKNTDSNGRFHSDWCSMMYSRLLVAKNLLKEDGVIFISIDDNEVENLKRICDEIFGNGNFIGNIIPIMNPRGSQSSANIAVNHEYILVLSKNIKNVKLKGLELTESQKKEYNKSDEFGVYRELGLRKRGADSRREDSPTMFYSIYFDEETGNISTKNKYDIEIIPRLSDGSEGRWRWSSKTVENEKNKLVVRKVNRKSGLEYDVFTKDYLNPDTTRKVTSIWDEKEINNEFGTELLKELFGNVKIFNYSKPLALLKKIISISSTKDDLILDFFSGSASTAHAVMDLNFEDKLQRKFIMVQLPEDLEKAQKNMDKSSRKIHQDAIEFLKKINKPYYLSEIGKERIRRAGNKIKSENPLLTSDLDTGFRVLKVDSSNMKDVYYSPNEISQDFLSSLESNIKEDRTDLDLLFGCLLEWGLPLSLPYNAIEIDGCMVHNYNDGDLIACFEENISENVMKEIAKLTPLRAVFRDSSFENSAEKINTREIFKLLSPNTKIKVI